MRWLLLPMLWLVVSCTITHEYGELPRVNVDLPIDSCDMKVRKSWQGLKCYWEF